jgi:hypothetical protein
MISTQRVTPASVENPYSPTTGHVLISTAHDEFVGHIKAYLAQGAVTQVSISDAMAGESWGAKVRATHATRMRVS